MTDPLTATMTFTNWDETPGFGPDAPLPRLAHADVAFAYSGALQATSACHYVLSYGTDGSGEGLGYETVSGRREATGEEGTFVLRHESRFGPDGVDTDVTVVAGSGTGGFSDLSGAGHFAIGHGTQEWPWALEAA